MEREPIIWKVVLSTQGVETVYLVTAHARREAELAVLESIPLPTKPADADLSPGDIAAWRAVANNNATPYAYCAVLGCSIGATPWTAEHPYRLYTLDTKTGAMS